MSGFEIKRYWPHKDGFSSCGTEPLHMLESNTGSFVKVADLKTILTNNIHDRKADLDFMIGLYSDCKDEAMSDSLLERIVFLKKDVLYYSKLLENLQ